MTTFSDIIDAADQLSMDEQEALVEIIRRRIAQQNRAVIISDVAEARAEYASGTARALTAAEIMDEARGEP